MLDVCWVAPGHSSDPGEGSSTGAQTSPNVIERAVQQRNGVPRARGFLPSGLRLGRSGKSPGSIPRPQRPFQNRVRTPDGGKGRTVHYLAEGEEPVGRQPHGAGDSGERAQREPRAAEAELPAGRGVVAALQGQAAAVDVREAQLVLHAGWHPPRRAGRSSRPPRYQPASSRRLRSHFRRAGLATPPPALRSLSSLPGARRAVLRVPSRAPAWLGFLDCLLQVLLGGPQLSG